MLLIFFGLFLFYEGKQCQELEDPCFIAPCAEGATCSSSGQDFVCTCPADFTGTLCEVSLQQDSGVLLV